MIKTDGTSSETVGGKQQNLFEYIEVFYNRERLQSTRGYLSPAEYESRFFAKQPGVWSGVPLHSRPTPGTKDWNDPTGYLNSACPSYLGD
ncbi:MAG: IS3 family transposase [Acidobacteriota bacterium]|nr:MAG: IS3 family transposase [Acidobacteriota bacterium]